MTKEETVKIMAMLGAFYAGGKNEPKVQAQAWHLILQKYDYKVAECAVLNFAENDTREYATFPAVGKIVAEIKAEVKRRKAPVGEITYALQYGKDYSQLSDNAKLLISEEVYSEWLSKNAEELPAKLPLLAEMLTQRQPQIERKYGKD